MNSSTSDTSNSTTLNQTTITKSAQPFFFKILLVALVSILTLLPIVNILSIIVTTGTDNPSNDFILHINFLDQVLSGNYNWLNYFRDTFQGGAHSMAIGELLRIGLMLFAHGNIYGELLVGFVATLIRLILLYSAFTRLTDYKYKWLLLPLLSALIFSNAQINLFSDGESSIQHLLHQLGFTTGIWALIRFEGRWAAIVGMVGGGVLATLTWGGGPFVWPTFFVGMLLLGYRKRAYYLVWLAASVIAALPYVFFIIIQPIPGWKTQLVSILNYKYILNEIGWPFTNDFAFKPTQNPTAFGLGLLGLIFCLLGLRILWTLRQTVALKQAAPALMLIINSLMVMWQISLVRIDIPPWYVAPQVNFWLGLLGLAYVLWLNRLARPAGQQFIYKLNFWISNGWSLAFLVILIAIYASSNLTYTDKAIRLYSRSPASAACLRNYRVAPTYCELYLFQVSPGLPGYLAIMAEPLERYKKYVFAPRQQWTLQGDFVLDTVRVQETPGVPDVIWSADRDNNRLPWYDYHHLNLFLPSPNSISWTINLPTNLEQAEFQSAITISNNAASNNGAEFEVYIERTGEANKLAFSQRLAANQHDWQAFSIPLNAYIGQTITLRMTSRSTSNSTAGAMYRYPLIDVQFDKAKATAPGVPPPFIPEMTANDVAFIPDGVNPWQYSDMQPITDESGTIIKWRIGEQPKMVYSQPLNVCLADYSHFYMRMAATAEIWPRAVQVFYLLDNQPESAYSNKQSFFVPINADDGLHDYTYDLKLLELPQNTRLTGLRLTPMVDGGRTAESTLEIAGMRLLRPNSVRFCGG